MKHRGDECQDAKGRRRGVDYWYSYEAFVIRERR